MIKLINTVHNTEIRTHRTRKELDNIKWKEGTGRPLEPREKALIYRIRKALCGVKNCTCGNFWGERN